MYACASRFWVSVRRAINSDASKCRGTEVIVTNYLGAPDDESEQHPGESAGNL